MHQFFPSRKSSTPGSAAQPASERDTLGSAEQPAGSAGQPASSIGSAAQPASERDTLVSAERPVSQLQSLKDVQKWLATDCVTLDTTEIRRLRHAVQILANAKPKKEDIRLLQQPSNWNVHKRSKKNPNLCQT